MTGDTTPISDEQRALQEQLERPNFEGHEKRECGEHRTVGPHRAWCYDCTEWCYPRPEMACKGCMVPMLQADVEAMVAGINRQSFETMSAQRDELRTVVEGLRAELARTKAHHEQHTDIIRAVARICRRSPDDDGGYAYTEVPQMVERELAALRAELANEVELRKSYQREVAALRAAGGQEKP